MNTAYSKVIVLIRYYIEVIVLTLLYFSNIAKQQIFICLIVLFLITTYRQQPITIDLDVGYDIVLLMLPGDRFIDSE